LQIEELVKFGTEHELCVFKSMHYRLWRADIIFIPYNYLLYPEFRSKVGLDLKDKIILIDEAHNIS